MKPWKNIADKACGKLPEQSSSPLVALPRSVLQFSFWFDCAPPEFGCHKSNTLIAWAAGGIISVSIQNWSNQDQLLGRCFYDPISSNYHLVLPWHRSSTSYIFHFLL